jgi:DNA-binding NarL/FixJ family response regulator
MASGMSASPRFQSRNPCVQWPAQSRAPTTLPTRPHVATPSRRNHRGRGIDLYVAVRSILRLGLGPPRPSHIEGLVANTVGALEIEVVASTRSVEGLLASLERGQPDVVIVEDHHDATGADAATCVARMRDRRPTLPVLVISGHDEADTIAVTLAAGAFACVLRTAQPSDLAAAIRQVFERSFYLFPSREGLTTHPRSNGSTAESVLTVREREVLQLVAGGCSNLEIATRLGLGISTVKAHLSRAYQKLGVRNRTEAILSAKLASESRPREHVRGAELLGTALPGRPIGLHMPPTRVRA